MDLLSVVLYSASVVLPLFVACVMYMVASGRVDGEDMKYLQGDSGYSEKEMIAKANAYYRWVLLSAFIPVVNTGVTALFALILFTGKTDD